MPYRLNKERLYKAAAVLGDTTDLEIRERTGIAVGTLSRLVNQQVEPSVRHLDLLSRHYGIPVQDLYINVAEPKTGAVA